METYITSQQVQIGQQISKIKRMGYFTPEEWEEVVEEWLETKCDDYIEIERLGGAGDQGRDVVAYINDETPYQWDCYQCKHYRTPLAPSDVWLEFGKIIYFTYIKQYPVPNKYYLVAPKGVGTKLSSLLRENNLKTGVKKNWDMYCKDDITAKKEIKLEGELLTYFDEFDFSIFDKISPKVIISEHIIHLNHSIRFGGGLPAREKPTIPSKVQSHEAEYIHQLMVAYNSDHELSSIKSVKDIKSTKYLKHFQRARKCFHHSEQLRNFSRDSLPNGVYDNFQDEIFSCIADTAEDDNDVSGFIKVKKVEHEARQVVIESNPLKDVCTVNDKTGVCHQLANNGTLTWVDNDE